MPREDRVIDLDPPTEREKIRRRCPTYPINAWCENCLFTGQVAIPKGTPVPWGTRAEIVCPECGCNTVFREDKPGEVPSLGKPVDRPNIPNPDVTNAFAELLRRQQEEAERRPVRPQPMVPMPYQEVDPLGAYRHGLTPDWASAHTMRSAEQPHALLATGLRGVTPLSMGGIATRAEISPMESVGAQSIKVAGPTPGVMDRNGDVFTAEALANARVPSNVNYMG